MRRILAKRDALKRVQPAIIVKSNILGAAGPLGFLVRSKYALLVTLPGGFMPLLGGLSPEDAWFRASELRTRRAATGFHLWN